VGQHQRQVVAAGLGADLVDRAGQVQEVLALVDDQDRVAALRFRPAAAGGGGLPRGGDHERAEQPGGVVAEHALGQPAQQDAAVEDGAHVEAGGGLPDDAAHEAAGEHGP
jgi:hypothetical protein